MAVTGTPKKSAGEVKGRLNVALYLPDSVRCLSVAVEKDKRDWSHSSGSSSAVRSAHIASANAIRVVM